MAITDYSSEIANLRQTYKAILDVSDLDNLRDEVAELTEEASSPTFWDDPDSAQKTSAKLSHKQGTLDKLEKFAQRIDDAELLVEMPSGVVPMTEVLPEAFGPDYLEGRGR